MTTQATARLQTNDLPARWLRFLSRWALAVAFTALGLTAVFLAGVGIQAADAALGPEYTDSA